MDFHSFEYQRPVLSTFKADFEAALVHFETAETVAEQNAAFERVTALRSDFESMNTICSIRHTVNTKDAFYERENDYFDEISPDYQALVTQFYKALLEARFRVELEQKWGQQLFILAELSLKTFEPTIMNDLQEENRLCSEYTKLLASCKIEFQGKTYNLSGLSPIETGADRELRQAASEAKWSFFEQNAADFDRIFDELVKTRHRIAVALGYKNFIELGYARMNRSDYTPEMVANYRQQIYELIVPIATRIRERQQKRLGLDTLYYYDEGFSFNSGNPRPKEYY